MNPPTKPEKSAAASTEVFAASAGGPGGESVYPPWMLSPVTTRFIQRLRSNDQAAWFELWEMFGPVVRAQLMKWGKGRIGAETVRDLSQETLAALSESIDRYDPARGARFSTWLLAIAKHVLGDELDRRNALKRGGTRRATTLDDGWMGQAKGLPVDAQYESQIFAAKVEAALRAVEKESDFTDFSIFTMRVLEGMPGKDVAAAMGISEPTVSRRLAKVRELLRARLANIIATYSFTEDERQEAARNGLDLTPKHDTAAADDALFDEAIAEIHQRQDELRREDQARRLV
ncbi:MAG: sigma-70 family RNA polymerase sigma factor [Phycisphaeraceae bacterium]|nr:sigma-70 family RNA polymerase sigma factor [Phycisphaeraceae bacterium]